MPIYLNYNKIPGDVTESTHTGWIELNSCQWGIGRGISSPTGGSADRESSGPIGQRDRGHQAHGHRLPQAAQRGPSG